MIRSSTFAFASFASFALLVVACGESPPPRPPVIVPTAETIPSVVPVPPSASAAAKELELVVASAGDLRFSEARLVSMNDDIDAIIEEDWGSGRKHERAVRREDVWFVHSSEKLAAKAGDALLCRIAPREWKPCLVSVIHDDFGTFDVLDPFFKTATAKRLEFASVVRPSPAVQDAIVALKEEVARKAKTSAFEAQAKKMSGARPAHWKPKASLEVLVRSFWGWVPAKVTKVYDTIVYVDLASGENEVFDENLVAPLPSKKLTIAPGAAAVFRRKGIEKHAAWDWVWPYAKVSRVSATEVEVVDMAGDSHTLGRSDVLPLEP